MTLNLIDRSNYLKALLILTGKDKEITTAEREMIRKIASVLGFEKVFTENAMDELSENQYISDDPPKFSDVKLAEVFIKEGIRLHLQVKVCTTTNIIGFLKLLLKIICQHNGSTLN